MRWAYNRDKAEKPVVATLEAAGWLVYRMNGAGLPDLLCVRSGRVVLLEVKSKGGRMKPAQVELHARLRASGLEVAIVTTPEEALAAVGGGPVRTALDVRVEKRGLASRLRPASYRPGGKP
jgi:hypothetical protein